VISRSRLHLSRRGTDILLWVQPNDFATSIPVTGLPSSHTWPTGFRTLTLTLTLIGCHHAWDNDQHPEKSTVGPTCEFNPSLIIIG